MTDRNRLSSAKEGSLGELLAVAVPLVLSAGSLSLMNVIDRVFLTWYSTDALAASLPAAMLHWTIISFAIGVGAYVNTFVAQYDGASQRERASAAVWQGIYLSLIAGSLIMPVMALAPTVFAAVGHDPAVQQLEVDYFQTLVLGTIPFLLSTVISCFYSGRGRTQIVLLVNIASLFINAGLDRVMIFGAGPIPEMGIAGAAGASVLARIAATLCFVALIAMDREARGYAFWQSWRWDSAMVRRLLKHGSSNGFLYLVDTAGFLIFIFLLGNLGRDELAATNLAFNLNSMAYIPMLGVGTAVMTLVGQRIGAGKPELAVQTTWNAFWGSSLYMLVFAICCLTIPDVVLFPYAYWSDPAEFAHIRDTVVVLLRFVAVYTFFDAMAIVFSSAVRGAGDTLFSFLFTFGCCWLLMVLPTFIAISAGGGLFSGWFAVTTYITVIGTGFLLRFQSGKWKSMRTI